MLALLRRNPAITYALIGLLAALFIMMLWQHEESPLGSSDADLRGPREPDSFIVNAVYRSYDPEGRLSSQLETERAEQFEGDNYALMQQPDGALYEQESGLPWLLDARHGRYDLGTEELLLTGDVVLLRENPGMASTQLSSERLMLDNQQRIVHTDAPVTLVDFRGVTDAVGMRGWIDDRVIELQSQVEGEYDTQTIKRQP